MTGFVFALPGVTIMTAVGALLLSGFSKVSTPWHLAVYSLTAAGMMSGCSLVILGEAWHGGYVAMGVGFLAGLLVRSNFLRSNSNT